MTILLTGGAGYIGSHTAVELIESGHTVIIADNFSNSSEESVNRIEKITGTRPKLHVVDVCNRSELEPIFQQHHIDGVIHFAGLKAVGESVEKPLEYYSDNLISTLVILKTMATHKLKRIVFSSSATVYGTPSELPLVETSTVGIGITNPYGWSKFMNEQILRDASVADTMLEATILRYFNPIGAHESGQIGEDPSGIPLNILPYIAQTAVGKREYVTVFGNDYDTPDGSGVRDYIHIVDLARGHIAALEHSHAGCTVYNLGSGQGTSVLELIDSFSKACGHEIPYKIGPRRPGDIASCYAKVDKANQELNWHAEKTIDDACKDSWRWQSQNPNGYNKS